MPHDESPTARALLTLELLQGSPGITAERLGEKLGVSERAARRYVAILREAGIEVRSTRGPYGGYRLGRGVRTPPLMFSTAEALGLVMAVLDGHHDVADTTSPVGAAISKITRVLPEPVAQTVEAVRRTTAVSPDRAAARPSAEITTQVVQACLGHCRIEITYLTERNHVRRMRLDPWAVVVRYARWYLLCWSHSAQAQRTLRIDRIKAVDVSEETFTPPEVDPVETVEANLAEGWDHPTEVVFEAPPDQVRRHVPRQIGRLEPAPDGHTRLIGTTSAPDWYAQMLLDTGLPFRIEGGDELRQAVAALADRLRDALR